MSQDPEKAALVGVVLDGADAWETQDSMDELALLADTAGTRIVNRFVQTRAKPDPATYIGKGKVAEIADHHGEFDLVIFDDDLTPAQSNKLEDLIGTRVVDRSWLILNIFARRARSREARTQVELAQLQYLLPRLAGRWVHLERQAGGFKLRGPGETQLETDRRLVHKRIARLTRELKDIEKARNTQRQRRLDQFKVAIVGYTNAGKSTLMNALTDASVFVEDRLFATLDATVRTMKAPDAQRILLIDTVGFIRKLPHHLVASFRSTLEETILADLLMIVADLSHPHYTEQMRQVESTLQEMGLKDRPRLLVFNKLDQVKITAEIKRAQDEHPEAMFISALKGIQVDALKDRLRQARDRWMAEKRQAVLAANQAPQY